MGTSRKTTESQLQRAQADLEQFVGGLKQKNVEPKAFKKNAKWRQLDARVRQISMRLRKVTEVESQNEELTKHQAERKAQVAAQKADRKAEIAGTKPKPPKEPEKPKAKPKEKAEKSDAPKVKKERPPKKDGEKKK